MHPARFTVLVLPGHRTIHWSSLSKIKALYDRGGCVIATDVLPSKSAEFGHDADVLRTVEELFEAAADGVDSAAPFTVRQDDLGGRAIRLLASNAESMRAVLDVAWPDCDVSFEPGRTLRYLHNRADRRHLFFFANLNPELRESMVTLRGRHEPEAMDKLTPVQATVERRLRTRRQPKWSRRRRSFRKSTRTEDRADDEASLFS